MQGKFEEKISKALMSLSEQIINLQKKRDIARELGDNEAFAKANRCLRQAKKGFARIQLSSHS